MTPTTNEQVRTALAWRRTALALVVLSLAIVKLIDWTGPGVGAVLGFACLVVAALIVGFAEQGVRRMGEDASRPILPPVTTELQRVSGFGRRPAL